VPGWAKILKGKIAGEKALPNRQKTVHKSIRKESGTISTAKGQTGCRKELRAKDL
jgi:hypothetical protein